MGCVGCGHTMVTRVMTPPTNVELLKGGAIYRPRQFKTPAIFAQPLEPEPDDFRTGLGIGSCGIELLRAGSVNLEQRFVPGYDIADGFEHSYTGSDIGGSARAFCDPCNLPTIDVANAPNSLSCNQVPVGCFGR